MDLVDDMKNNYLFQRWCRPDCCGSNPSNLHLLTSGFLRYLARGWMFDFIEEATVIARETHRVFFMSLLNMVLSCYTLAMLHRHETLKNWKTMRNFFRLLSVIYCVWYFLLFVSAHKIRSFIFSNIHATCTPVSGQTRGKLLIAIFFFLFLLFFLLLYINFQVCTMQEKMFKSILLNRIFSFFFLLFETVILFPKD